MAHAISNIRTIVRAGVTKKLNERFEYTQSGYIERRETFQITLDGADTTAVIDATPATGGLDLSSIFVTADLEAPNAETLLVKWDRITNKFRFFGGGPDSQGLRSPANGTDLTTELTALMAGVAAPTPALPVLYVSIKTA